MRRDVTLRTRRYAADLCVCSLARLLPPAGLTTRVAQLILHDLEMPYDIAFSIDSAMLAGAGSDAAMDG